MKQTFANRLKSARKMHGLSMQALADRLNITKQMISKYEHAKSLPDSDKLIELANILNVKPDYFFRKQQVSLESVKFRKKSKLSKKRIEAVKAKMADKMENYLKVEDILSLKSKFVNPLAKFKIQSFEDIEKAAEKLRKVKKIGNDPMHSVVAFLESNGIKVVEIDEPDLKLFDGLSANINDAFQVIVVNKNFNTERKRFTLLHELGHLLLNVPAQFSEKEEEKLCNRFAGAMLLPKDTVYTEIGENRSKISLNELINFQKQFGISIRAQIYRLTDLEIISEYRMKQFYMLLNADAEFKMRVDKVRFRGNETSERFIRLVYKALSQEIISAGKASALLNTNISEVNQKLALI